jgi:hypothetical protein
MKFWIVTFITAGAVLLWFKNELPIETAIASDQLQTDQHAATAQVCLTNLKAGAACNENTAPQQRFALIRGQLLSAD